MPDPRPVIGVTLGHDVWGRRDVLRVECSFVQAIQRCGGVPLVLAPHTQDADLARLLELVDGILLPGGADVDPALYGELPHPSTDGRVDRALDDLELRIMAFAVDSKKPVLGICRGMQLINVFLGGTLIQDLPSHGIHGHSANGHSGYVDHHIRVEPGSRLHEVLGPGPVQVNSYHHQGIGQLGRGLRAVAYADDGLIEGFESVEEPWLVGVQSHPEQTLEEEPSLRLLAGFVEACAGTPG